ncbi:MAG: phosphoadenylyl-sulfate reductase [Bacteroidales bacterium]|nr:phosphoadenylyl-sulfate reductase [Bacteroidales bacterium]
MNISPETAATLNIQLQGRSAHEVMEHVLRTFGKRVAISSSLSLEDQVLTDMAVKIDPKVRVFTLDTGRLFPETYQLIDKTAMHYGISIDTYFPRHEDVERMVHDEGINLFYNSIESRHRCCQVRKLEPLARAFSGLDAWICGLRRQQSVTRQHMHTVEWDAQHGIIKVNPLIGWSEEEVWTYIREHHVPYNRLHDQGYPSIGCQPCTRPVKPGDDIRSGRWWWESPEHRECGLHRSSK